MQRIRQSIRAALLIRSELAHELMKCPRPSSHTPGASHQALTVILSNVSSSIHLYSSQSPVNLRWFSRSTRSRLDVQKKAADQGLYLVRFSPSNMQ